MPITRTCLVSYRDFAGLEHSVEVSASSLYEAAVLGIRAFRTSDFNEDSPGPATRLKVTVKAEESHEVRVSQIEAWLSGSGKSPREEVLKSRLRELLNGK